jgi:hypothetical protein
MKAKSLPESLTRLQDGASAGQGSPLTAIEAKPYEWIDPPAIEPRDRIYGHLFRKFIAATIATPGLGKTSLTLVQCLAIVTGRDLLKTGRKPKPGKAWYFNGEDPYDELQRRIQAVCLHYGIKREDIEGRFFVNDGRTTPIIIATETRDGTKIWKPTVEAIVATIRKNSIDALTVDPFVSCHRVSENDNTKIEAVVWEWAKIADEAACALALVHHPRKTNGYEVTIDDARGASALIGKARSAWVLNRMTQDEGSKARVEDDHRLYFRVDDGKPSMTPPSRDATWYRLVGIGLNNARNDRPADNIGVVSHWEWPAPTEGLPEDALEKAKAAIAPMGSKRRSYVTADDWVGKGIGPAIGIDPETEAGKEQLKSLIVMWLRDGHMEKYEAKDAKGTNREYVRPVFKGGETA